MKEKLNNSALPMIISALYIIVFNVLAFVLSSNLGRNFWCGYIFVMLSWICLFVVVAMATGGRDGGKSLFLNAPGLMISVIHLLIQTVIAILIMAISTINVKVAMCFEILLQYSYGLGHGSQPCPLPSQSRSCRM